MAISVKKNFVPSSKYSIKCPYSMDAEYITLHNTANDASAENEIAYMVRNNNQVSYHFAIDDKEVIQGIPTNRNAWHCGDGGSGTGNRKSIGIEICYSKSGGERYRKAEALAIKFIAQLLRERGWGIDRVKPHQHWSGKYCPHRILKEGRLNQVMNAIEAELKGTSSKPSTPSVSGKAYTIKKGDTLWGISQDTGISVKDLEAFNPSVDPKGLVVGSSLNLAKPSKGQTYTVKAGDTLWGISRAYKGIDVGDIKEANNLKSDLLSVGQKLVIPTGSAPTPAPKPTAPSYVGKRVEAKTNVRFYGKPSWEDRDVVGTVTAGLGFTIVSKLKVGSGEQYKVKNSKGSIYYITANGKYVKVE